MERVCTKLLCSGFLLALFAINLYAQRNFVYTNNNTAGEFVGTAGLNAVSGFSVSANGIPTQIPGSPFATGGTATGSAPYASNQITVSPVANLLFASNNASNSISGFSIDPITGILTPVPGSPFPTGSVNNNPFVNSGITLAVTSDGRFLFAGTAGANIISTFAIDANGALEPVMGASIFVSGVPDGIKVSQDGKFLSVALVGGVGQGAIGVFRIGAGGGLTPVPGSPFQGAITNTTGSPAGVEFDCAGNLLFVAEANIGATILDVLNVALDGSLTQIPGSPFGNVSNGDNSNVVILSPNGQFLFVSNQRTNQLVGSITVLSVALNGILSSVPGSPFANTGGQLPAGMATDKAGTLLYVANGNNTISIFRIAGDGTLAPVSGSPFAIGQFGFSLQSLAAFPPKNCALAPTFDICIQDDSSGSIFKFNSTTGDYQFTNCSGFTLSGTGTLIKRGGIITLQHYASDRRVLARIDTSVNKGTASIQVFSSSTTFTITDRNTTNNRCTCTAN